MRHLLRCLWVLVLSAGCYDLDEIRGEDPDVPGLGDDDDDAPDDDDSTPAPNDDDTAADDDDTAADDDDTPPDDDDVVSDDDDTPPDDDHTPSDDDDAVPDDDDTPSDDDDAVPDDDDAVPDDDDSLPDDDDVVVAPPPPSIEARFNIPVGTDIPDLALEDSILDFIDRTPAAESIRVSMYTFSRSAPANALVAAQARGVDVQVVLDGGAVGGNGHAILQAGLPASNLHICQSVNGGSCIGTANNHSKYFLFSYLGPGESEVVVQSSANLTNPQLRQHNNLVIVRGDSTLYGGYQTYWADQAAQASNANYYWVIVGDLPVRTYFYPRASGDTILSVLDNVVCGGNAHLRVAMSLFTDARSSVAVRLGEKVAEGCTVEALLKDSSTTPGSAVLSTLLAGGVDVSLFVESTTLSTIHSKYLLVDSHYDTGSGPTPRELVFTGSHNYTGNALRNNDEQLMRVDDATVFADFWSNWDTMRATVP